MYVFFWTANQRARVAVTGGHARSCASRRGGVFLLFKKILAVCAAQVGTQLMTPAGEVVRELPQRPAFGPRERYQMAKDTDHTMALASETLADGKSVLIFCATKRVRCMGPLSSDFGSYGQELY